MRGVHRGQRGVCDLQVRASSGLACMWGASEQGHFQGMRTPDGVECCRSTSPAERVRGDAIPGKHGHPTGSRRPPEQPRPPAAAATSSCPQRRPAGHPEQRGVRQRVATVAPQSSRLPPTRHASRMHGNRRNHSTPACCGVWITGSDMPRRWARMATTGAGSMHTAPITVASTTPRTSASANASKSGQRRKRW